MKVQDRTEPRDPIGISGCSKPTVCSASFGMDAMGSCTSYGGSVFKGRRKTREREKGAAIAFVLEVSTFVQYDWFFRVFSGSARNKRVVPIVPKLLRLPTFAFRPPS